jgi:hypothetical protein
MTRNWLLAHWRRILMQAVLVGVLAITLGLAALATHQKRLALRLPLSHPIVVGRLRLAVPRGWSPPAVAEETTGGDIVSVDELLPDGAAARRITIQRNHLAGLVAPLEYLLHTPWLTDADIVSDDARNPSRPRIQSQDVAGWPGIMISRTIGTLGGRRVQKQVIACSVVPPAQAVVVRLDDAGPTPDVANEELVREIAENLAVRDAAGAPIRPEPASFVALDGGIFAAVPDHFCRLPADRNRTSIDFLSDGRRGGWATIELIPCLWYARDDGDDGDAAQFLSLLAIRDQGWRGGIVKKLTNGTWQCDRPESAADAATQAFPTRGYCLTSGSDQALIAILHAGFRDDSLFDDAWRSISANVRFTARRDLPALLDNGSDAVATLVENGADQYLSSPGGHQIWSLWDQAENADKRFWMQLDWAPIPSSAAAAPTSDDGPDASTTDSHTLWRGARSIWPERPASDFSDLTRSAAVRPARSLTLLYGNAGSADGLSEGTEQLWTGTTDFTLYTQSTDRTLSLHGQTAQRTATQRWDLRDGKLRNHLAGDQPLAVPEQFVPGAWLPLILGKLVADKPLVLRTESFLGCDAPSTQSLLTLYVTRVRGEGMPCVTVTVNGTGHVTRWWYDPDGSLRYIDFPTGLRAQRNER